VCRGVLRHDGDALHTLKWKGECGE